MTDNRLSAPNVARFVWPAKVLLLTLTLGASVSCRRLVAHAPAADFAADRQSLDLRTFDDGVPGDRGGEGEQTPDLAPPDLAPPDLAPPDLPPPDLAPPDLPSCMPATTIDPNATTCTAQCTDQTSDVDCDGLPDGRDPQKTGCQPLLLLEDFAQDPVLQSRWTITTGNVSWSCGQAVLSAGTTMTLAKPLVGSSPSNAYLVEAHFTLGKPQTGNWGVAIKVGLKTGFEYKCEAWMSTKWNVKRPGAHLNILGSCGKSGTWDSSPKGTGQGAVGETYILQFWYAGKGRCRLLRDDGTVQNERKMYTCSMKRPDTFSVSVRGRAATFSHIRAFAFPN